MGIVVHTFNPTTWGRVLGRVSQLMFSYIPVGKKQANSPLAGHSQALSLVLRVQPLGSSLHR